MSLRTSCWGKPAWVRVYVSEHLSFTCLGKTSRGKPRSKPESGNPTFRDCRGARGNVTLSFMTECARLGSIPTRSRELPQVLRFVLTDDVPSPATVHRSRAFWIRRVTREFGRAFRHSGGREEILSRITPGES